MSDLKDYAPEEVELAETLLALYRALRVLQLMDESGIYEWEGMTRDEMGTWVSLTGHELGTADDPEAQGAIERFICFRAGRLREMRYVDYLRSPEWKDVRRFALKRAGGRCQVCNRDARLQVHHRNYDRRGCEKLDDVTVLCGPCHETFHRERGMPWRKK